MSVEDVIEYLDNLLINQNRWDGRGDCGEMNNIKAFLNGVGRKRGTCLVRTSLYM